MNDIFAIVTKNQVFDRLAKSVPHLRVIYVPEWPSADALHRIAQLACTSYFYIITDPTIDIDECFQFDTVPDQANERLVHVCGSEFELRMYPKKLVLQAPDQFSDDLLFSGALPVSFLPDVTRPHVFDVIFLSYQETDPFEKFRNFQKKCPRAKHVHGVKGILNAHRTAAMMAETDMFFVVDADAEVCESFKFDYRPHPGQGEFIHVWRSYNPSIGLSYGYGGIKLFPTGLVRLAEHWNLDFTTSLGTGFVAKEEISNITRINETPFDAWKSAFREVTKLVSGMLPDDNESSRRLRSWLEPVASEPYCEMVKSGADAGRIYAAEHMGDASALKKINDYNWLWDMYNRYHASTYYQYFWEFRR